MLSPRIMYNPRGASSTPRSLEYTLSEHPSRITFVTWSKPRSVPTTCLPSLVMTCTRASTIPANDGACPPPPPPPPLAARIIATNRPTNDARANAGRRARIARTRTTTRAPTNERPAPSDASIDGRHPEDGGEDGGEAGAWVRAWVFELVLCVFLLVCVYNQADKSDRVGQSDARVDRRPASSAAVVGRVRVESREAPGTRRERRSRARVGARARGTFFATASSRRSRASDVAGARRGCEKGAREGQSRARGAAESCANERSRRRSSRRASGEKARTRGRRARENRSVDRARERRRGERRGERRGVRVIRTRHHPGPREGGSRRVRTPQFDGIFARFQTS